MKKSVRIISRKSILAKIQARMVGDAIKNKFPGHNVEYCLLKTQGDFDQKLKLAAGGNIGVFTSDISKEVLNSNNNIAVHSWKDYPIADNQNSQIYATLKRGDIRDILFLKKKINPNKNNSQITIMTSSPRRRYSLEKNLKFLIPLKFDKVCFDELRGNIGTRIKKFEKNDAVDGIVVAKAAVDRILTYSNDQKQKLIVTNAFSNNHWMILPLSIFPTAPAQGAIGIEVAKNNPHMIKLVDSINDKNTFENVMLERNVMSKYGGGCSQKIGVSIWRKNNLTIKSIFGLTEKKHKLKSFKIINQKNQYINSMKNSIKDVWPKNKKEQNVFIRKSIKNNNLIGKIQNSVIYVTRKTVLDDKPKFNKSCIIYTSGVKTWKEASKKGYWVHGSCDSMGESEIKNMIQTDNINRITKLTFLNEKKLISDQISCYELKNPKFPNNMVNRKEYFWMSFYTFELALKKYPELLDKNHSCGMGNTYNQLLQFYGNNSNRVKCYLSYKDWISNFKDIE